MTNHTTDRISAVIPYELTANNRIDRSIIISRIHCQIPYNNTVTTFCGLQSVGIGTGLCQFTAIEINAATLADCLVQTENRSLMLNNLIQSKTCFIIQTSDIGGSYTH